MKTNKKTLNEIDTYISSFPLITQKRLSEIRLLIKQVAPAAEEIISYQMPAYKLHGMLVYFAGYKNHIGFYPTASGIKQFQLEIVAYKHSKGAVQFPINEPIPADLVARIVAFRIKENELKSLKK
ncbi:MAG: DUF1801 domain-containing protein [Sediminibacterium sp.]|nr:MAG: DUF1801 domain-containing protein [Sediminibacterium sp.]